MVERLDSVTLEDFQLFYEVYGEGDTVILCMHGNSRNAKDFKFLASHSRKVISIHLFLHEHSTFDKQRIDTGDVKIEHIEILLNKILEKENVNKFHWLAYSQGGRFTFAAYPLLSDRVLSLSLIAPDGLDDKNFYSWSQRQALTRWLFRYFVKHPKILINIVSFLVKIKILHPQMIEFMEFYTSDPKVFQMAYDTWASFRNIRPSVKEIRHSLEVSQIPFMIIIGEYDNIITAKTAKKFAEKIGQTDSVVVIPFGHNVFKPHIIPRLSDLLRY